MTLRAVDKSLVIAMGWKCEVLDGLALKLLK